MNVEAGERCDELVVRYDQEGDMPEILVTMSRGHVCWKTKCEEVPPPNDDGLVRSMFDYCEGPPPACP